MLVLASAAAFAADFPITITNHSSATWSEGLLVVSGSGPLLDVGALLHTTDAEYLHQHPTFQYSNFRCSATAGDVSTLESQWSDASWWEIPSLAPGQSTSLTVTAEVGESMSFIAKVVGGGDDVVMMNVPGDTSTTEIPLFNSVGLPLFAARFDISGYDASSHSPTTGHNSGDCGGCPANPSCYVVPDNNSVRTNAGGDQAIPADPDFYRWDGTLLDPVPGTFYENGLSAPAVLWDPGLQEFLMFFETNRTAAAGDCPFGTWAIGMATSPDGVDWTVAGDAPLVDADAATPHRCVAAHPSALMNDDGVHVDLFFKEEQGRNACAAGAKTWGCKNYVGVGHAVVDPSTLAVAEDADPVLLLSTAFGFPRVAEVAGGFVMLVQQGGSIYRATSTSPSGPWTKDASAALVPGALSWNQTELFNPDLVCEDDGVTLDPFPYTTYVGGRTVSGGVVTAAATGDAISQDAVTWLYGLDPTFTEFSGNTDYRHWSMLRTDTGDTLMYFSELDGSGKAHVGLAGDVDEWDLDLIHTRICVQPAFWP